MEQDPNPINRDARRMRFKQALDRATSRAEQRRAEAGQTSAAVEEPQAARSEQQAAPVIPSAHPLSLDAARILDATAPAPPEIRRPPLILAPVAGLAWGGVVLLLLLGNLGPQSALQTRLLYALLLLLAGLLTFMPLQWSLRLPSLTWRGTVGWGLLFYTLAFVPAPGAWLLSLPELPVYLLLAAAVFLAADAAALPAIYALGLRLFHHRPARFDLRRSRRQAAEVGLFAAGAVALAAIEALTPVSLLLLLAILGITEVFILGGREA